MKILLMGRGHFAGDELEGYAIPPAWRKATRNMIMATASIERALAQAPGWIENAHEQTGLVLGSNSGELETSSEFLMTLARTKVARPLLFQNSLHNATTGFASIHYKLTGPTFSISSGQQMPKEALLMALTLLQEEVCGACLVTLVEGHKLLSGFIQQRVNEGAATVLLANADFALRMGFGDKPEFPFADWSADYVDNPVTAPLTSISASSFYQRAGENT